jgi:WD40-like Beta Propeller Repeat
VRKRLIGLASGLALLVAPSIAHAGFPGLNGKIAFDSHVNQDEVYVVAPDGSGRIAIAGGLDPVWSPDGTKIAFILGGDIFVMNADGSGQVNLTPGGVGADGGQSWSADGGQIVFWSTRSAAGQKLYKMDAADGSDVTQVTTDGFSFDRDPAWSSDGQRIAFERGQRIYTVRPDGTNLTPVTPVGVQAAHPNWAPSGARIAYSFLLSDGPPWSEIHTIEPDGSNDLDLGNAFTDTTSNPAWSPDGSQIAFRKGTGIWRMNADGSGTPVQVTSPSNSGPDWQPLPFPGYPRPVAASPVRASLVPAYAQCAAPNRTHGPPLAFGSCHPPAKASSHLTVGTPDANGAAAKSVGFLKMRVAPGAPGPPSDTQVWIDLAISDVRCDGATTTCGNANTADGADYTGELEGRFTFRGTDKYNGPNRTEPATMTDYTFRWAVPCSQTADPSIGAHCSMNNLSMDAVVPGIVLSLEGKRAIWGIEEVRFYDGGSDGDADTAGDNSLFATQGLFVP